MQNSNTLQGSDVKKNEILYNSCMNRCPCHYTGTRTSVIYDYYIPRLNQGEEDHEKLGWESREAQFQRFDVLLNHVSFEGHSVLDVGCGLGNLLDAFKLKNLHVRFTGVDIVSDMILRARQRHPESSWHCCDIFSESPFGDERFDVVFSSGIFNIDLGNNPEFLVNALALFLALSNEYVCFNLLSDRSTDKEEGYYYYSAEEVKQDIINRFSLEEHQITIKSDYLENDFTIIIKK